MKKIIIIILTFSFLKSYSQEINFLLKSSQLIHVSDFENSSMLNLICSNSESEYICFYDSIKDKKLYHIKSMSIFLSPNFCQTACGIIGFSIFDNKLKLIADWSIYYEGAKFHSIKYYYCRNNKTFKYCIDVGCYLKGKSCEWNGFTEVLFKGNTLDKNEIDFKIILSEILNRSERKFKKSHFELITYMDLCSK